MSSMLSTERKPSHTNHFTHYFLTAKSPGPLWEPGLFALWAFDFKESPCHNH